MPKIKTVKFEQDAKPKAAPKAKAIKPKDPRPCIVCGDKGKTADGICQVCGGTGRFTPSKA